MQRHCGSAGKVFVTREERTSLYSEDRQTRRVKIRKLHDSTDEFLCVSWKSPSPSSDGLFDGLLYIRVHANIIYTGEPDDGCVLYAYKWTVIRLVRAVNQRWLCIEFPPNLCPEYIRSQFSLETRMLNVKLCPPNVNAVVAVWYSVGLPN